MKVKIHSEQRSDRSNIHLDLQDVANKHKNVKIMKADMTCPDKFSEVAGEIEKNLEHGGLNVLINNAGMMIRDNLKTVTVKDIEISLKVNAVAPLMFTKALLPLLTKADGASTLVKTGKSVVMNISSQLGSIQENTGSGYVSYRLSKSALNMATKVLDNDLRPLDVFVLALHPGWVKTDMGGPDAAVTAEDSVKAMLDNVTMAEEHHRGCLLGYKLRVIPW